MAIQDDIIATRNYQRFIEIVRVESDIGRMCHKVPETVKHLISSCSTLAPTDYLKRHNLTAGIIHQNIAIGCKIKEKELPFYKYVPEAKLENERNKLYWDITILTVEHNRPDITLTDIADKIAYLNVIAHPADYNLHQKEKEELNKYFELVQEYKNLLKGPTW